MIDSELPDEMVRIRNFSSGELHGFLVCKVSFNSLNPMKTMENVKGLILKACEFKSQGKSDDDLYEELPTWLMDKFEEDEAIIIRVCKEGGNLWHGPSWAYSIMSREWEWYSSEVNEKTGKVLIFSEVFPFDAGIHALMFAIESAGGFGVEVVDL